MNSTEKLKTEYKRLFHQAYHGKVLPVLKNFENTQKQYRLGMWICTIIVACLTIFLSFVATGDLPSFIIPFGITLIFSIQHFFNKKFVKELKKYALKPLIQIFGDINYKQDVILDDELTKSDLFSFFNIRKNDDGFYGTYKGVNFEISETRLLDRNSSFTGKYNNETLFDRFTENNYSRRRYQKEVVFDGVIIKFALNKFFNCKTLVVSKGDLEIKNSNCHVWKFAFAPFVIALIIGLFVHPEFLKIPFFQIILAGVGIGLILHFIRKNNPNAEPKLNKIHLEDPVFEKKFKAYSTDEIEGRYLLTTAFMERFLNLQTAFGVKNNVKCAFFDNSVMFAIPTHKDLFEIGSLYQNLGNPKQLTKFFDEFSSILMMVEHFKFDQKLGL